MLLGDLGDSFALGASTVMQTKQTATSTTRLTTIPQYTHDISHTPAGPSCESSSPHHVVTPQSDSPTSLRCTASGQAIWILCCERRARALQKRRRPTAGRQQSCSPSGPEAMPPVQ